MVRKWPLGRKAAERTRSTVRCSERELSSNYSKSMLFLVENLKEVDFL